MSYFVSARKYRPRVFSEIIAQSHISQTLQNAVRIQRVAHGYIFSGSRGIGKTTVARILAKVLNCQAIISDESFRQKAEPCNVCESCTDFDKNQSLNIFEFDAASNNSVDDVRLLRENIRYAPPKGKYRVYIIDEFHMLSVAAFNAFLKTLEEPPPHAVFIFATTELHKVPLTISSRCQKFFFKRISFEGIVRNLKSICQEESIQIEQDVLELISQKSDGAMRDALSLLDQVVAFSSRSGEMISYQQAAPILNTISYDILFDVTDAFIEGSFDKMLRISTKIYENGYDVSYFIGEVMNHLKNLIIVKAVKSSRLVEVSENIKERYKKESETFTTKELFRLIEILADSIREARLASDPRLILELTLLKIASLRSLKESMLETRVLSLEKLMGKVN